MLLTVRDFTTRVESDLNGLIDELQAITGRYGAWELRAWQRSLPQVSVLLSQAPLQDFHVHLGQSGGAALEYRLPASSSWCDVVLLGASPTGPSAVVLELKDWDTSGDQPGPREGLVMHNGALHLHPAEQVRAYVEYCRRFHSAIVATDAAVNGCVFFTARTDIAPYVAAPHARLTTEFPVFSQNDIQRPDGFPTHIARHLVLPDEDFAHRFDQGSYVQDRNFVIQVAKAIQSSPDATFVLLDEQRRGFELCMATIDKHLAAGATNKAVIIVEGPPGSGKSVLAAQLWAGLASDERIEGSVVLTTTSGSQRSNWEKLFEDTARGPGGRGLVMPANRYNPGLSPRWVKAERESGHRVDVDSWRDNVRHYLESHGTSRLPDDHFAVSIVDESHALIDPTAPNAKGIPPSGWSMHAGPQAWHIIRASRVSIFLLDGDQSYRDNETTTSGAIEAWAHEFGVTAIEHVSLAGAQFRCCGSVEYVRWLESLLGLAESRVPTGTWRRGGRGKGLFQFDVVSDPAALDDALDARIQEGRSARLVAAYGRPWKTKNESHPHDLPGEKTDFHFRYERAGEAREWIRPWNYAPKQDYTLFVQAPVDSRMYDNALAEVGCPYVVRGFDFDYVGILWLRDLVWRDGHWRANLDSIFESAWPKTLAAARRDPDGPAMDALVERLARGYRILLTRAIHGVYVWFEDEETRRHVGAWLAE